MFQKCKRKFVANFKEEKQKIIILLHRKLECKKIKIMTTF